MDDQISMITRCCVAIFFGLRYTCVGNKFWGFQSRLEMQNPKGGCFTEMVCRRHKTSFGSETTMKCSIAWNIKGGRCDTLDTSPKKGFLLSSFRFFSDYGFCWKKTLPYVCVCHTLSQRVLLYKCRGVRLVIHTHRTQRSYGMTREGWTDHPPVPAFSTVDHAVPLSLVAFMVVCMIPPVNLFLPRFCS